VSHPLESVQIDHTLADIRVVEERDREAIGRPWLTLAIDVLCRAVLGFYVGGRVLFVRKVTLSLLRRINWVPTK
jgi:putative transposase